MKLTFITTLHHNVGDDFVREGLRYVLASCLPGTQLEFASIHKHAPISTRQGFEWVRRKELSAMLDVLPLGLTRDRLLECNLLVQSGAPVYWCHRGGHRCSQNEWYRPLMRRRYARIREEVPFLNLAAGSCQPYYSDGAEFWDYPEVLEYIRDLHDSARVTTVRDRLSQRLLSSLGLAAPLIPCASIFARDALEIEPRPAEFVALNFMRLGGHYDLNQNVRAARWEATFRRFYEYAKRQTRCVFICHDAKEVHQARRLDPHAEVLYSRDYRDYMRAYAAASTGILNRVHGAFAISSFGRPAFVIGNDSRSTMVEEIGLRHGFVDDASFEQLVEEFEAGLNDRGEHRQRFDAIRARALADYQRALSWLSGFAGRPSAAQGLS